MNTMNKGFTLLELIIIIVIIGVLGTLGFTQYTRVVEKGRTSEAKIILGQIRSAQTAYRFEYGTYAGSIAGLSVEAPISCTATHYFLYGTSGNLGGASRCTSGGKTPNVASQYNISINYDTGVWNGTAGYY